MEITVKLDKQRIADLLISAFEGGSGYWCRIDRYARPGDIVCGEASAILSDREGGHEREEYTLNADAVRRGLAAFAKVAPRHFGDWLAGNDDATTGDAFLQCCLFGELVYG